MWKAWFLNSKGPGPVHSILQGGLTENALLNKDAALAAKKHLLLSDPMQPPTLVNAQNKPMSQELTKLTKQSRQFPSGVGLGAAAGPGKEEEEEEEEDAKPWKKR